MPQVIRIADALVNDSGGISVPDPTLNEPKFLIRNVYAGGRNPITDKLLVNLDVITKHPAGDSVIHEGILAVSDPLLNYKVYCGGRTDLHLVIHLGDNITNSVNCNFPKVNDQLQLASETEELGLDPSEVYIGTRF